MSQKLPVYIDPYSFADRGGQITGDIDISSMQRLLEMLADSTGLAKVDLSFYKDNHLSVVQGHVEAEIHLQCQNCLETMLWSVDKEFKLAIVSSIDAVNLLSETYEPLLLQDSTVALAELIEEELMLTIPLFPKHQIPCVVPDTVVSQNKETHVEAERDNPFSILTQLKNNGD